ncbi:hypothetical protein [Haloarchaeobius sp. HRN-SO-5]|uniref:hypothetical protein n=1 Tax=Haloarchaeobius sp. HRN-SO-5 TaxID=3446118 RepID=UPI003EC092E2
MTGRDDRRGPDRPRVDVLRYPPGADGPRVRAVRAGDGETRVQDRERRERERRADRLVYWVGIPLAATFMSVGPAGVLGLPGWSPLVAGVASFSLLWWVFDAVDARRDDTVPELVATDCSVTTARERWNATVVDSSAGRSQVERSSGTDDATTEEASNR